MERFESGKHEASAQSQVQELLERALSGDQAAGDKLSRIAIGGHPKARRLIKQLDQVSASEIYSQPDSVQPKESKADLDNLLFSLTHPFQAFQARSRQIAVQIEHNQPPAGHTYEEFPNLPLRKAASALKQSSGPKGGGVPQEAWTPEDQERMKKGQLPQSPPLHPNV